MTNKPPLPSDWMEFLREEFNKDYMNSLRLFLKKEIKEHTVYPPMKEVFNAFFFTPFKQVKVIIIGQDPYHNQGQAHGLSFSVRKNMPIPPSLLNIFKEIYENFSIKEKFQNGELIPWAEQGVFLLNSVLTVRKNQPGSHRNQGWENFTNKTIATLSSHKTNLVFLLWGKFATQKKGLIDPNKHLVLESPHPSPYSADRGFFGCRHFSKTNEFLKNKEIKPVNWNLGVEN